MENEIAFRRAVLDFFGGEKPIISRAEVLDVLKSDDKLKFPQWLVTDPNRQVEKGVYKMDADDDSDPVEEVTAVLEFKKPEKPAIEDDAPESVFIPATTRGYVPFGDYPDILKIIESKVFYPTYIAGLSGNGKTAMVKQACAVAKREFVRVNITIETDEDDLLGGFRLVKGETVWHDGPVIVAMKRGAVLLLDEIDLGSNKLMCLQPVLEGEGIFLKKIGEFVRPKRGFNVIATANTKGQGSDDGKFIGTNILNEAFLERFSVTFDQSYPDPKVEKQILDNVLRIHGIQVPDLTKDLVSWANITRKAYLDGSHTELISTRRLVHICEAFVIFNRNELKAVKLCLSRFDSVTREGFTDLFKANRSAPGAPSKKTSNAPNVGILDKNNSPF